MKIELHLLQNFAPSNLNRDDTGAPKDCEFGGHRRARISSQCQKRAVREMFRLEGLLGIDELGVRTKRLAHEIVAELEREYGYPREDSAALALGAIEGVGLGRKKKASGEDGWKTEYLLFVPRRIVKALAELLYEHRDQLQPLAVAAPKASEEVQQATSTKRKSKKDTKKAAAAAYPNDIRKAVEKLLEEARGTVDLALFGRMIADKPKWNVDASCQVAHAMSTNTVKMDFDFFTAVDDFKPDDTSGSDMLGTIQFNSSCFYRYAVLDVTSLRENLGNGESVDGLLDKSVDAFVRAFVSAIPTGKQNSMAAHNVPSYALGIVRDKGQPVSLANAFLKPARPRHEDGSELDLVDDSISKLESYFERISDALGPSARLAVTWADRDLPDTNDIERVKKLGEFFDRVTQRAVEDPA